MTELVESLRLAIDTDDALISKHGGEQIEELLGKNDFRLLEYVMQE